MFQNKTENPQLNSDKLRSEWNLKEVTGHSYPYNNFCLKSAIEHFYDLTGFVGFVINIQHLQICT
jgi:hypothetical protein